MICSKNKEMKRVTNKELISVILINIGALAFAIYIWFIYDHRQTIINMRNQYKIIRYWKLIAIVKKDQTYS